MQASRRQCFTAAVGIISVVACLLVAQATASSEASSACKAKHKFPTISKGKLTIAGGDFMPAFNVLPSGKMTGADGDILTQIGKWECLKTKVVILPAAGVLASVQSKRVDVAAGGWYKKPERGKVVGQTVTLYADYVAIVSKAGYSKLSDLQGKDVAVVQGTVFATDSAKVLGEDHVKLYQDADGAFQDTAIGRVDAWIAGLGEGALRLHDHPGSGLQIKRFQADPQLSWTQSVGVSNIPYTKSNKRLGAALNADLTLMRNNGMLKKILKRWNLPPVGKVK